jgi:hypothetical protein
MSRSSMRNHDWSILIHLRRRPIPPASIKIKTLKSRLMVLEILASPRDKLTNSGYESNIYHGHMGKQHCSYPEMNSG